MRIFYCLFFFIILSGCSNPFEVSCSEKTISEVESENYVARFFEKNCGATTDYSYQLSIENIYTKEKEIVFISDGAVDLDEIIFREGTLIFSFETHPFTKIIKEKRSFFDMEIIYRNPPPEGV